MRKTQFTLQPVTAADDASFIDFWAHLYGDDWEDLYVNNISIKPFTDKAIRALFVWKNGGELSAKKKKSVEKNYVSNKEHEGVERAMRFSQPDIKEAEEFAKGFLTNDFLEGGAIWRIFWLHCCNQLFPIYDQHVHRAMIFIEEGRIEELSNFSDEQKIESYLTRYLRFHRRFAGDQRKIDKALNTFGRFIKAWPGLCP